LALRITSVRICNGGVRFGFTDSSLFGSDLVQPRPPLSGGCQFALSFLLSGGLSVPGVEVMILLRRRSGAVVVSSGCGGVAGGSEVMKGYVLCGCCVCCCSFLFQHKQSCYCYYGVFHSNHGDLFLLPSLFLPRPCLLMALGVARL
jgi:hypothetical protein